MVSSTRFEFLFNFSLFFFIVDKMVFFYGVWLYRCTTINLFVRFRVSDSDGRPVSIGQRNHIKYLFVSMFHRI